MIHTVKSDDGTNTAYSEAYGEHYHSTRDGALHESLCKHVIPALLHVKDKAHISILDICFGLGFNTLATLYYIKQQGIKKQVRIVSPERDADLIASLKDFEYPKAFASFLPIINSISDTQEYRDETLHVRVVIGDAREYLQTAQEEFDIVYHDAFSPNANPLLWTQEYFAQIAGLMNRGGILTTYSTALKTRLALHANGFKIYLNRGEGYRNATLASFEPLGYEAVDMAHKVACNPGVIPLKDEQFLS